MASNRPTPEEMLMKALGVIKEQAEQTNVVMAEEPPDWEQDAQAVSASSPMAEVNVAEFRDYTLYAVKAKLTAMRKLPPEASRISWSINRASSGEAVTGGGADTMEQAMRFAEIAYRAMYGLPYKGDA